MCCCHSQENRGVIHTSKRAQTTTPTANSRELTFKVWRWYRYSFQAEREKPWVCDAHWRSWISSRSDAFDSIEFFAFHSILLWWVSLVCHLVVNIRQRAVSTPSTRFKNMVQSEDFCVVDDVFLPVGNAYERSISDTHNSFGANFWITQVLDYTDRKLWYCDYFAYYPD